MPEYNIISFPYHYTRCTHEVVDLTSKLGFCLGNVIKYVLRAPFKKKEAEDMGKAAWYLNYILEHSCLGEQILVPPDQYPKLCELVETYRHRTIIKLVKAAINSDVASAQEILEELKCCAEHAD